jgi:hypothetical protein
VIATTATVSFAALGGWSLGLTWHARRTAGWLDPGARLAWTLGVGALTAACVLIALLIALLTGLLALLVGVLTAALSAPAGWWACEHMSSLDAGERRDSSSGVRWEVPRIALSVQDPRRLAAMMMKSLARLLPGQDLDAERAREAPATPAQPGDVGGVPDGDLSGERASVQEPE